MSRGISNFSNNSRWQLFLDDTKSFFLKFYSKVTLKRSNFKTKNNNWPGKTVNIECHHDCYDATLPGELSLKICCIFKTSKHN